MVYDDDVSDTFDGRSCDFLVYDDEQTGRRCQCEGYELWKEPCTHDEWFREAGEVCAGGRSSRGKRRIGRNRRFLEKSEEIHSGGSQNPEGRSFGGTSGNRKDIACKSCGRRSGCSVLHDFRF